MEKKGSAMASPSEKLADSLAVLRDLQGLGRIAIKSSDLTRTHRERLVKTGFLKEVIRAGIFLPDLMRPQEKAHLGSPLFGIL
ncbi:hypothetical protein [Algoriphagus boritolerans]|uniref:hypothetical protein n=1 Tax=Algoriphagus boritolerans TaxID=308111 RepID=UPI002FCE48C7